MADIKAQTTQTLKIVWNRGDTLTKKDLIQALTVLLPNEAIISDLAVGDATRIEPEIAERPELRTFTITFTTMPTLRNIRR